MKLNLAELVSLSTEVGVVTPTESFMTNKQCDFMEGYWTGESAFNGSLQYLDSGLDWDLDWTMG